MNESPKYRAVMILTADSELVGWPEPVSFALSSQDARMGWAEVAFLGAER